MENNTYYHISKVELEDNTLLHNGRYGLTTSENNRFHKHKEFIFDNIRKKVAPTAPSRLNCIFLFNNLESAYAYRLNHHKYSSFVYEVNLFGGEIFNADHIWLDITDEEYKQIEKQPSSIEKKEVSTGIFTWHAERYWTQKTAPGSMTIETLATGDVQIKKVIAKPFFIGSNFA